MWKEDGVEEVGGFKQRFHRKERRQEKWSDDILNNVCHGGDVRDGEMWGQELVSQK